LGEAIPIPGATELLIGDAGEKGDYEKDGTDDQN
jgi:hypothetical protein